MGKALLTVLVFFILGCAGSSPSGTQDSKGAPETSGEAATQFSEYTMELPLNLYSDSVTFRNENGLESSSLAVQDISDKPDNDLQFFTDSLLKLLGKTTVEVTKNEPSTLAGRPARRIEARQPTDYGMELRHIYVLMTDYDGDGKHYQITFLSSAKDFDRYLPVAEEMLSSLQTSKDKLTIKYPSGWKVKESAGSYVNK